MRSSDECRRKRDSRQTIAWQKRNWKKYLEAHKFAARRRRRQF